MVATAVCVNAPQCQLIAPVQLLRYTTGFPLQTENCEVWHDVVLQRDILAAAHRKVFQGLSVLRQYC